MKNKPVTNIAFFHDVFDDFTIVFCPHSCFLPVKFEKIIIDFINIHTGQTYKNKEEWLYWHRKCLYYYFSFNLTRKKQENNREIVKDIMEKCHIGDWFLLHLISKNTNLHIYKRIVKYLANVFWEGKFDDSFVDMRISIFGEEMGNKPVVK